MTIQSLKNFTANWLQIIAGCVIGFGIPFPRFYTGWQFVLIAGVVLIAVSWYSKFILKWGKSF